MTDIGPRDAAPEIRGLIALCDKGSSSPICTMTPNRLFVIELLAMRADAVPDAAARLAAVRAEVKDLVNPCAVGMERLCTALARATVRVGIVQRDFDLVQRTLRAEQARIDSSPASASSSRLDQVFQEFQLYAMRAEAADAQGLKLDAAVFFRKAMALGDTDPLHELRAQELWAALGGSPASWTEMVAEDQPPSPWEPIDLPFDLAGVDLNGRQWSTNDVRGKIVLVSFWASWCAPCIAELPYVQQLRDRVAGDPSLMVLTINLDENAELAAPIVKDRKLTIPVVLGYSAFPTQANGLLPLMWIVAANGRAVRSSGGFRTDGSVDWVGQTLSEMQSVALGAAK